ncbi:MAG: hypothetical protein FWG97_05675 [Deltaproteobacteria bacterium]|nr:hypothetical protein [Deltaproteobacteria bacterium]
MIFPYRLCALCFLAMALAGCGPKLRLSASFHTEDRPAGSAHVVAEDLARTLADVYPPGHTAIFLSQTGAPHDELGPALEAALRVRGFTLAQEGEGSALTVAYVLDRFNDHAWFAKLAVSDGFTETRVYQAGEGGLEAQGAARTGETRHE